jgi:transcriptional regulator with XRE-family HTH domain
MVRNTYEVQNVGDLLREKRRQLGKDIKEVAEHTKIRAEYLIALETGQYDKFASDVYAKGFLKKYAKYLGISPERASAMYRRESRPQQTDFLHDTNYLRKAIGSGFQLTAGRLFTVAALLLLIVFSGYLLSQVSTVLQDPELQVSAPISATAGQSVSYTTTLDKITLRGNIELGSSLTLNGSQVNVNNLQLFEVTDLPLAIGENRFVLKALSQFGQEAEVTVNVIRDQSTNGGQVAGSTDPGATPGQTPPTNPTTPTTPTTPPASQQPLNVTLQIGEREAYVQVKVDGQVVFAQVMPAGSTRQFTAQTEFSVSSPRPDAVKVLIDEEQFQLSSSREHIFKRDTSGAAKMTQN